MRLFSLLLVLSTLSILNFAHGDINIVRVRDDPLLTKYEPEAAPEFLQSSSDLANTASGYSTTSYPDATISSSDPTPTGVSIPHTQTTTTNCHDTENSGVTLSASSYSSSKSSVVSNSSTAPPTPTSPSVCEPKFILSGVSEASFNPIGQGFSLNLTCGSLDVTNYTVLANWKPVIGTSNSSTSIDVPGLTSKLLTGYVMLTIYALETSGWPIIQSFQLLFGSATLKVVVQDDLGSPAVGVAVLANTTTFLGIGETAVTDPDGTALFKNVPSTTISLKADGSENKVAVGSLAGGLVATVNMKLLPLHHPIAGAGGFDVDNGTLGWTGGTTKTITKRDSRLVKRDTGLVVSTNFSPDVQTAYQSFDLAEGATLVYLKYQFQTEEVPSGFYGSQFNDYFSIVIRADDESSTTVTHSMNELGLGNFDAAGSTKEFTTQMALADAAQYVEFMVAVSNVADELYQSQLVVRKVGVCDKCASCDDCPDLAKCQDACKNPPANSCTFYRSCAEETLKCGSSGYPIAYGELACYRFQNNIDEFSTVGKAWVTNTEQCLQEALVPFLNCDTTCDAVMFAGSDSLYTCYVQNDICSLEGMEYVRILNVLETEVHRGALRAAIGSQEGCSKAIVKAIDTDIQKKVADGAAGSDVLQNAADAHALALARKFYLMIIEDQDLDVAAAVKYIKQIQDTAAISPFSARDPNILTTDYLRHNNYNDYQWTLLVGGISPLWIMFAEAEGVQMYHGYTDPASPAIVMDFAHTFATMGSVYVNGENSAGDITGWLGDLFTFYGDWKRSGVASGKDFSAQNLGQQTQSTFPMADLRGDADGYNIAMGVKNGAYPSIADGFAAVMQGGYASRFKDFFQARFQGSATVASSTCMDYMTAKALDRPLVWKARRSLAVKFGVVPFPEDIPRADLQGFCDGFADALANFAANG